MSKTTHMSTEMVRGYVIHFCNGRASDNRMAVTDNPEHVTCVRCQRKLEKQGGGFVAVGRVH